MPIKAKDFATALDNFERNTMGNKKDPKIYLYGTNSMKVESIPFGVPAVEAGAMTLDEATGIGGLPRGRITELFGPESSGKSWLAMKALASAQRMGLRGAWLDPEFSFVGSWAQQHGIDLDTMAFANDFECGEEVLTYVLKLCEKGVVDFIAIDSVAALVSKAELERKLDEATVGAVARMMSTALKQIAIEAHANNVAVVFINQIRDKIGVMFGNPETTPGGKALKFYSSMRVRTWRKKVYEEKDVPVYAVSGAKIVKNKVARPMQAADYAIYFDTASTDPALILVRSAINLKLFNKKRGENDFFFGPVKGGEETGCKDLSELADWLRINDRIESVRQLVVNTAKDKDEKIDPVLQNVLPAVAVPSQLSEPKEEREEQGQKQATETDLE